MGILSKIDVFSKKRLIFKEKSFNMFEGMFSIAIFNEKDFSLTLARDKFGEKPLYYFHEENNIYFGSFAISHSLTPTQKRYYQSQLTLAVLTAYMKLT